MQTCSQRVEEFKKQNPNFSALVDQSTEIPLAARDQIFRMRNGPDIALFLSFAPDVCSHLCKMDPVKAAETIEDINMISIGETFRPSGSVIRSGKKRAIVRKPRGRVSGK